MIQQTPMWENMGVCYKKFPINWDKMRRAPLRGGQSRGHEAPLRRYYQ